MRSPAMLSVPMNPRLPNLPLTPCLSPSDSPPRSAWAKRGRERVAAGRVRRFRGARRILTALALLLSAVGAAAQGTAFTYQGQLQNNGSPASGTYNLQFFLYTNSTGGMHIAGPVETMGCSSPTGCSPC
jgi:hypothetical protein